LSKLINSFVLGDDATSRRNPPLEAATPSANPALKRPALANKPTTSASTGSSSDWEES
jgi:hypothetical protein|tara:strand:- start:734 stop:907 length:174 start_codon:yes stop_codon:yes gene_type:complete